MRKLPFIAILLCALPVAAQQPQDQPAPAPPPVFEKPQEAQPEPEAPKPTTAPTPITKPKTAPSADSGKVMEEIIARVNNDIITKSEYEKSLASAEDDARQDCQNRCTAAQLQGAIDERRKGALKELIDQSLLVQRGKDMGLSVETDVIKQLDSIRTQNNIASMEDLEKAVTSQGLNWEDFKNNIRNRILTQKVVGQEVGSHINVSEADAEKYYNDHKADFIRPEQVALSEIQVTTQGKTEAEIVDLRKKIDTALKRVRDGESFAEIAKRFSDGSTAKQGGYLGQYKRGELAKQLEDVVFAMKRNQISDVIETKQGFLVLQVLEHYDEGQQPLAKVDNEIKERLYNERMEPALKEYLKTLREQSYVVIKPEYKDIAGGSNSEIQEVSATPEKEKDKKGRKKFLLFGKRADS